MGGASGLVCPPHPVLNQTPHEACRWSPKHAESDVYVFCHMDAHMGNVYVDPQTLDITCLIDFEFSGFYPQHFDLPLYEHEFSQLAGLPERQSCATEFLHFLNSRW